MKLTSLIAGSRIRRCFVAVSIALLLLVTQFISAAEPSIVVVINEPAARQVPVPASFTVDLKELGNGQGMSRAWQLEPLSPPSANSSDTIPVQFEPTSPGSTQGTLWFVWPPSATTERRFRLVAAAKETTPAFTIMSDTAHGFYDVREGKRRVLRYNHGTVPAPAGVDTNYARGDYIMPLFGPNGEVLTDDYPPDHPHHRGVGWSWPVTRWGKEVRDIWAVQGVWARPVAMRKLEAGPVCAVLDAESVWKWGNTTPIVREDALIRVFRWTGKSRIVDVELRLLALQDGVAIGGRPHGGYGGFGLRAMPAQQRVITAFTDPPERIPRRCWLDYSGVFAGGNRSSGLAIFEHIANLYYPNALLQYPELNYVMPAFPGEREVPLSKDQPLVLKHRLWIHAGMADEQMLAANWAAYAHPPQVRLEKQ